MRAQIADVVIEFMEPDERSYPSDCIRISRLPSGSNQSWSATLGDLANFLEDLDNLYSHARGRRFQETKGNGMTGWS